MAIFVVLIGCSPSQSNNDGKGTEQREIELTISAAASLRNALSELKSHFEQGNKNIKIAYNFGSSGALQQQITQGAPVDMYFSAAKDKYDYLVDEGMIAQGVNLLTNELVLIAPKEHRTNISNFEDLTSPKISQLAIGIPESVPAGKYAKEALLHMDLWEEVEDKLILSKDVRQVLTYVETGNVDAGMVYKTDALISSDIEIVDVTDKSNHSSIIYPVGIIKDTKNIYEVEQFFEFLQSEQALTVFEKFGFKPLE
ncbi:molybdate ABC transporter substrate-binding protein [Cytobacillus sp. Hm23]